MLAFLLSGIGSNPNSPITIAGVHTTVGTVLVAAFLGFALIAGVCFSPRSDGKGDRSPGMGCLLAVVFLIGLYAVGLMAH